MDHEKVNKCFGGISTNMLNVRKQLSKQIRGEKRSIKVLRTELKRRKHSLQRLSKQKTVVEENLRDLSDVRNDLACVTNDPVSPPTWTPSENESVGTSSSDDSDLVSCVYPYYMCMFASHSIALFFFVFYAILSFSYQESFNGRDVQKKCGKVKMEEDTKDKSFPEPPPPFVPGGTQVDLPEISGLIS